MPKPKVEVYATLPLTVTVSVDGILTDVCTLDRTLHFRVHLTAAALHSPESIERALDAELGAMRHDLAALVKGTYAHADSTDNRWWPEVVALVKRMVKRHA